MWLLV